VLVQACFTCNLNTLSANGNCMLGSYTITYSVTNDMGNTVKAQRTLVVYQAAEIITSFALSSNLSFDAAQQLAEDVINSSSATHAAAVQQVLNALSSAPMNVQVVAGDVDITWTSVVDMMLIPKVFDVRVNATIFVYSPATLHRKHVLAATAAATAAVGSTSAGSNRRLLSHLVGTKGLSGPAVTGSRLALGASMRPSSVPPMNDAIWRMFQQLEAINNLYQELDTHKSSMVATSQKLIAAGDSSRRLLQSSSPSLEGSLSLLVSALNASSGFVVNSTSFDNSTLDLQGVSCGVSWEFVRSSYGLNQYMASILIAAICALASHPSVPEC